MTSIAEVVGVYEPPLWRTLLRAAPSGVLVVAVIVGVVVLAGLVG